MRWTSIASVVLAAGVLALAPARAADDDWGGARTFEGEAGDWRPLDSMPDEAMPRESMPDESMPLDGPVDSRRTDSEDDEGAAVAPRPREMMGIGDDASRHRERKPQHGELQEAVPVDDDGVQPAPGAVEPLGHGPND
ncbi:hypothetical protein KF840_03875 [bacterium]|nr:hypothetical protein [bacterium]